jgi:hypothetical protein
LLGRRPTPKLEDNPLSAVRDCLFNIFAGTLHIEGRSSIRNPKKRHAVVTGTHLSHGISVTPALNNDNNSSQGKTFERVEIHLEVSISAA